MSCSKKAVGNMGVEAKLPEELETELIIICEPESILVKLFKHRGAEQALQFSSAVESAQGRGSCLGR